MQPHFRTVYRDTIGDQFVGEYEALTRAAGEQRADFAAKAFHYKPLYRLRITPSAPTAPAVPKWEDQPK
jgi:hypothetical protein